MAKLFKLPKIGVNMTEAVIVEWHKKVGDIVQKGDYILDAETDKAVQEIASTMSGKLAKILVPVNETVSCQQPIAIFVEENESFSEEDLQKTINGISGTEEESKKVLNVTESSTEAVAEEEKNSIPNASLPKVNNTNVRIRISPLAKALAKQADIDIHLLSPLNENSRIVKADVLRYQSELQTSKEKQSKSTSVTQSIPYSGIRRSIGERMLESHTTKPTASLTVRADVSQLIAVRAEFKKRNIAISYNDLLIKVVAQALKKHQALNSQLTQGTIQIPAEVNIGLAIDSGSALYVPVVQNADLKGLAEIHTQIDSYLNKIKENRFSSEDAANGTFTITNLGGFGIEQFTPIINPPQCAILAVGAIVKEPVFDENGSVAEGKKMALTLVFDHRIVDGLPAALFLKDVKELLEWPLALLS